MLLQLLKVPFSLKDFHQLSQNLLLWLARAESRWLQTRITEPQTDPQTLGECQEDLEVGFLLGF